MSNTGFRLLQSRRSCHQCLHPRVSCSPLPHTPDSLGDSSRTSSRSGTGFYQITAFALVPLYMIFCMCPVKMKSLFPQFCGLLQVSPLTLKAKCFRHLSSQCWTARLTWGSELAFLCESLCSILILYFVGCPSSGVT